MQIQEFIFAALGALVGAIPSFFAIYRQNKSGMFEDMADLSGTAIELIEPLKEELAKLKAQITTISAENAAFQIEIGKLQTENIKTRQELHRLTKENEQLRKDINELEQENAQLRADYEQARQGYEEMRNRYERLLRDSGNWVIRQGELVRRQIGE